YPESQALCLAFFMPLVRKAAARYSHPMTKSDRWALCAALMLLWIGLVAVVPTSVYWRDASEFVILGFFLDVAHPAGFPLFSQLSNLFALLPLGRIAWRVTSFCCLIAVLDLVLLAWFSYQTLKRIRALPDSANLLLSLLAPAILFSASSFAR